MQHINRLPLNDYKIRQREKERARERQIEEKSFSKCVSSSKYVAGEAVRECEEKTGTEIICVYSSWRETEEEERQKQRGKILRSEK
jgi:hypothetical protein